MQRGKPVVKTIIAALFLPIVIESTSEYAGISFVVGACLRHINDDEQEKSLSSCYGGSKH